MPRTNNAAPAGGRGDRLTGLVLAVLTLCVIVDEWFHIRAFGTAASLLVVLVLALLVPRVGRQGQIFVAVGVALAVALALSRPDWGERLLAALRTTAFIAGFFTALTSLRHSADSSPAIVRCGRFLAEQPPGRRYLALTAGGHLFALLLNYGAIALLGGLAVNSAKAEPNEEIRTHRRRRMLLAIQRGFISSLPWSPLAFAMAIATSVVPGATWGAAVLPCAVSSAFLLLFGWALDTIFKPRLTGPRPPQVAPEGSWALMAPLLWLLALLTVAVGGLHILTGIRSVGVVMVVVPLISVSWLMIQAPERRLSFVGGRVRQYLGADLPRYRVEMTLLMMAGFIGTTGAQLLGPVMQSSGVDLGQLPPWVLLLGLLWGIPVAGQIGANPILAVSLVAPILPAPATLGLGPTDFIVAITAGWALSGLTSPYTATTLLVGAYGGVPARHVGYVWNRSYVLLSGIVLSGWTLLYAAF